MAGSEEKRSALWQAISGLRDGSGCVSNIYEKEILTELMGCSGENPNYQASCFLVLIKELLGYSKEVEALLVAFGMLKSYDGIDSANKRRHQYYQDCLSYSQGAVKPDTLYRWENDTITTLEERLAELPESWIDKILKTAEKELLLPESRYVKKSNPSPAPSKTGNIIKVAFNQQAKTLNELQTAQRKTHEAIESIAGQTEIIPEIADGVSDANTKLDEISKLSSRLDRFDKIADAEASAGMNTFVYSLLGNITDYNPIEYERLTKELKAEIQNALNKSILIRLPDEALDMLDKYIDDNHETDEEVSDFIREQAKKYNIDIHTIGFDTLARFAELYKQQTNRKNELLKWVSAANLRDRIASETHGYIGAPPNQNEIMMKIYYEFIDLLIGSHANEMSKDELEQMRGSILNEIADSVGNEIFDNLPEDALDELEDTTSELDEAAVIAALNRQVVKYNLDTIKIISGVLTGFIDTYIPSK